MRWAARSRGGVRRAEAFEEPGQAGADGGCGGSRPAVPAGLQGGRLAQAVVAEAAPGVGILGVDARVVAPRAFRGVDGPLVVGVADDPVAELGDDPGLPGADAEAGDGGLAVDALPVALGVDAVLVDGVVDDADVLVGELPGTASCG